MILRHTMDLECPLCEQKLDWADPILADWYRKKVKVKWRDAHISWSYRDEIAQKEAVLEGKSKLNYPDSAHNKHPAQALDLFQLGFDGKAVFDPKFYADINDMNENESLPLIWGGAWKTLGDADHFQLHIKT